MAFSEVIETTRLVLRKPVEPDDAPRIFAAYGSDPEVTRYLTWRPHRNLEEAHRGLRTRLAWWDEGREYSWLITQRTDGAAIGMISASADDSGFRYSLGYVLGRTHWGRGCMTEAARAIVEHLFAAAPVLRRVWAVVDYENAASARVLEKVGMEREGLLGRWSLHPAISEVPRDCWCYALVR
jgi:ribosomal-protein-alanine N-acetyltransferase